MVLRTSIGAMHHPSKEQHPREYGGAVGWWGVVGVMGKRPMFPEVEVGRGRQHRRQRQSQKGSQMDWIHLHIECQRNMFLGHQSCLRQWRSLHTPVQGSRR